MGVERNEKQLTKEKTGIFRKLIFLNVPAEKPPNDRLSHLQEEL